MSDIYEILGPDGKVHYRRPIGHSDIIEALNTEGYTIRPMDKITYKVWWTDRKGDMVGNVETVKRDILLHKRLTDFILDPFDDITLHIEKVE